MRNVTMIFIKKKKNQRYVNTLNSDENNIGLRGPSLITAPGGYFPT